MSFQFKDKSISVNKLIMLIALILFSCNEAPTRETGKTNPSVEDKNSPVLAQIGDEKITVSELNKWVSNRGLPRGARLSRFREKIFNSFLMYRLVLKKAKDEGYARKEQIQRILDKEIVKLYLRENINKLSMSKKPSTSEVRDFYRQNQDRFTRAAMRRFSVLVLNCLNMTVEDCQMKKSMIASKITNKNFGLMARKYSSEPYSRRRSGDIGFVVDPRYKTKRPPPKGIEPRALKQALTMSKVGIVSNPIKTEKNYYFFLMTAMIPEVKLSFQTQKGRAMHMMKKRRQKSMVKSFYDRIYNEYEISKHNANIRTYIKNKHD